MICLHTYLLITVLRLLKTLIDLQYFLVVPRSNVLKQLNIFTRAITQLIYIYIYIYIYIWYKKKGNLATR
jgi:hypothetical protein